MVASAKTKITNAKLGNIIWTVPGVGVEELPTSIGYSQVPGPLVLEGPAIHLAGDVQALATTATARFAPGTDTRVKVRLKLKGLKHGLLYAIGNTFDAAANALITLNMPPTDVTGAEPLTVVAEQVAGPDGVTLQTGTWQSSWAQQAWYGVNAIASIDMEQEGNQEEVTVILQQPDQPQLALFCCTETAIQMPTGRQGIMVPHGNRLWLNCTPTLYDPDDGDGLYWHWTIPLCSCPPGQEQKIAIVKLAEPPTVLWHSQLFLLPPCPSGIIQLTLTYNNNSTSPTPGPGSVPQLFPLDLTIWGQPLPYPYLLFCYGNNGMWIWENTYPDATDTTEYFVDLAQQAPDFTGQLEWDPERPIPSTWSARLRVYASGAEFQAVYATGMEPQQDPIIDQTITGSGADFSLHTFSAAGWL